MVLIFSAPSGAGKSTLVQYLLSERNDLEFSISATTRAPRGTEVHGKEYYFLSIDDFNNRISNNEFVEYEQVYKGCYYGTLKSEVERIEQKHHHAVFDIDVKGGLNVKHIYGNQALAIFVAPPSIEILGQRLKNRGTDSEEKIRERLAKAEEECSYALQFDHIIVNDDLNAAKKEIIELVAKFLDK